MPDYLKPWRRKLGVITLVIACVFIAGWVRSYSVRDVLRIRVNDSTIYSISSTADGLIWNNSSGIDPKVVATLPPCSMTSQVASSVSAVNDEAMSNCLFGYLAMDVHTIEPRVVLIRYRTIVIPLTLLSVYLLLAKPRIRQQNP